MTHYKVNGYFTTDRPLTEDEAAVLATRLNLELEEPYDMDSERVDWTRTGDYDITVTPTN